MRCMEKGIYTTSTRALEQINDPMQSMASYSVVKALIQLS